MAHPHAADLRCFQVLDQAYQAEPIQRLGGLIQHGGAQLAVRLFCGVT